MLKLPHPGRRTVVIGGLALPLFACEPAQQGQSGETIQPASIDDGVVEFAATVKLLASGAAVIGTIFGLPTLRAMATGVGAVAGFVEQLDVYFEQRGRQVAAVSRPVIRQPSLRDWLIPPAHASQATIQTSRPSLLGNQAQDTSGDLAVPFVSGQSTIDITGINETGRDFAAHNVYSIVKRVGDSPPTSAEATSSNALPPFVMSMAAGTEMPHPVAVNLPVNQGYVAYAWCVPVGNDFTEEFAASNAMASPVFFNVDPYDYALLDAVRAQSTSQSIPELRYGIPRPG